MLYTASQMQRTSLDEATELLSNASYLTESESRYYPEMVPIRENARIGKNLVRVEDLVEYALSNGIPDGGVALEQICEASQVDKDTIALSVDEVSILEDSNMEETVRGLRDVGAIVYAAPISESDVAYKLSEAVVNNMLESLANGDEDSCDALFEAYINDNFDYIFSESSCGSSCSSVADKVVKSAEKSKNWAAKKVSSLRTLIGKATSKKKSSGSSVFGKAAAKMKQGADYLAKKLK